MTKVILGMVGVVLVLGGILWLAMRPDGGASGAGVVVQTQATDDAASLAGQAQLGAGTEAITQEQANPTSAATATTSTATKVTSTKKIMQATLHTNKGDITIEFLPEQAPKTVANFVKLAQSGFYDGTKFHRVIKGFMDQGGDPLTKDDSQMARWGTGGPGYKFDDEISATNSNVAGSVAMANSGPNTTGSQFFINAVNNPSLNSGYTVFGKVVAGMDVVTAINNVPTTAGDRPVDPVVLESVVVK